MIWYTSGYRLQGKKPAIQVGKSNCARYSVWKVLEIIGSCWGDTLVLFILILHGCRRCILYLFVFHKVKLNHLTFGCESFNRKICNKQPSRGSHSMLSRLISPRCEFTRLGPSAPCMCVVVSSLVFVPLPQVLLRILCTVQVSISTRTYMHRFEVG